MGRKHGEMSLRPGVFSGVGATPCGRPKMSIQKGQVQGHAPTFSREFLIFTSAFFLAFAFPKFNLGWTAWFALVPGLTALSRARSFRESFLIFFAIGFIFYFISVEWLRHVTYFGWIFVCTFQASYFGIFGIGARYFLNEKRFRLGFLAVPSIWVALEWIRTEIPVWAFGWNLIGYSQSSYLPVARLASWLGAYGVSFLILLVNLALWFVLESFRNPVVRFRAVRKALYAALILLIIIFHFGRPPEPSGQNGSEFSVSIVQGNIPQSEKWNPEVKSNIIQTYQQLSEFAAVGRPNLIVWPEAAWPGILNLDLEREQILKLIRSTQIPFLIGSPYEEEPSREGKFGKIFNSVYLMDQTGEAKGRYDKIRLVPFGEFVPLTPFFNLLGLEKYAYSLGVGDFSPGTDYKVFELPVPKIPDTSNQKPEASDEAVIASTPQAGETISVRDGGAALGTVPKKGDSLQKVWFSTLICFEDTFPELARRFVKKGAQFLVVVTNDAWFGQSAAPYQHLEASIFRAIEEGVPVVRAANTGVSAFISSDGEVLDRVKNQFGSDTWISGGLTRPILIQHQPTVYQQVGYLFPIFCLFVGLVCFLVFRIPPSLNLPR